MAGEPAGAQVARKPGETVSVLTYRMSVQDANIAGNVHGGWIMKLCDDVAAIAATRLAGGRVVTAAVDEMKFRSPVHVGDVLTLKATVNAAWRTSMEVGVRVESENVRTGESKHTCSAYLTLVSLGRDEKPVPLPTFSDSTRTPTSMDVRHAALTVDHSVKRSPTWTGERNFISSTAAVTTRPPASRVAAITAASSQSFMICPPWTLPARLASWTPIR